MGHHTKKHRKRTSRRGKYQKIRPKKTRRRRQTKRRGGACCGSKPSNRKSSVHNRSKGIQTIPASQTRRSGAEIAVAIMYGTSTRRSGTQEDFFGLPNDEKLAFCRVVLKDKTAAMNAGEGVKGQVADKLNLDIERISKLMERLQQ